jgi:hypothetical protein
MAGSNFFDQSNCLWLAIRARAHFTAGNSDLLTDLRVFNEYAKLCEEGKSTNVIGAFFEEVCTIM